MTRGESAPCRLVQQFASSLGSRRAARLCSFAAHARRTASRPDGQGARSGACPPALRMSHNRGPPERRFVKDELVVKKGGDKVAFYIVDKGRLLVTDLGDGDTHFENVKLRPGEHFGERAIVTGRPPVGNVVAQTDGSLFTIDKQTFQEVVGDLDLAVLRSIDKKCLVSDGTI